MSGMVGWLGTSRSTVDAVVTDVMLKISSESWKLKICSYVLLDCQHSCLMQQAKQVEADWTSLSADAMCGSKHNTSKKQPWTQQH
jgi:hypothetical protein